MDSPLIRYAVRGPERGRKPPRLGDHYLKRTPPDPAARAVPGDPITVPSPAPGPGQSQSEFSFLFSHLTGQSIDFGGLYEANVANTGDAGHEVTGASLTFRNVNDDRDVLKLRSIGGIEVTIGDSILGEDEISHGIQIRVKNRSGTPSLLGFGTGIQLFADDETDVQREFGNVQFFWHDPTNGSLDSAFAIRTLINNVSTILISSLPGGHLLTTNRLLATGGLGAGNHVAVTTLAAPGTVVARLPFYDDDGSTIVGSIPIYNSGSFS